MDDSLRQVLEGQRAAILKSWRDLVVETYSKDAGGFLREEKDPFANPVGATVVRSVDRLWDGLVGGGALEDLADVIDDICRLRAVQSFTPAHAVAFLPLLKGVVRAKLDLARLDADMLRALLAFESRVDQLTLLAFDTYSRCRERVFEIRATEIRSRSQRVLDRLNERVLGGRSGTGSGEDGEGPGST